MSFEQAVAMVFKHEGGYVNDPKDPGGETRWGISKRAYPDVDILRLTEDEAKGRDKSTASERRAAARAEDEERVAAEAPAVEPADVDDAAEDAEEGH